MSLEPPSPASSAGLREVECSPEPTPQLPETPPMTPPPGPEQHRDTAESFRATPLFRRLQARFWKTNKKQASQPPDPLSTESGQPVNLRFDSRSRPTTNIAQKGPSRMAAGQRVRVSVFFFSDWQMMCGMPDKASQRAVAVAIDPVRCSVCSLAPLFTLRDSVT